MSSIELGVMRGNCDGSMGRPVQPIFWQLVQLQRLAFLGLSVGRVRVYLIKPQWQEPVKVCGSVDVVVAMVGTCDSNT